MPNTDLLFSEKKTIKMLLLKFSQYSQDNTGVKFLSAPIFKNICIRLILNWFYEAIVWNFVSGLHLKPSWLSNTTKMPVAFKPKL